MADTSEVHVGVSENRTWFFIFGILLLILGVLAIAFPFITTIAAKIFLGWLFLIGGIVQIFHAFSSRGWSEFFLNLLMGILYLIAGAWLAFLPLSGIITLTIFLAVMFIVQGVIEIAMGFRMQPKSGWGWMLFAGIVAAAVGILILAGLPSSATWAIGLLVGVNLIMTGWAYLLLPMMAKAAD
ncbi:HdeD family acid-resistance protein [Methyloligella sp. 2.7D]|uniref:HdeD family acid-resistance protein n=1 Tax=unclassified Methyloligella TaxID=2625955 RepID=UPI00157CC454|nr:HdeD family acid-resistance protein [Methyloligella sp. GL2]QKP77344.1 HdeD family acid-resistance protein [Methyloligella sp. GL2]